MFVSFYPLLARRVVLCLCCVVVGAHRLAAYIDSLSAARVVLLAATQQPSALFTAWSQQNRHKAVLFACQLTEVDTTGKVMSYYDRQSSRCVLLPHLYLVDNAAIIIKIPPPGMACRLPYNSERN